MVELVWWAKGTGLGLRVLLERFPGHSALCEESGTTLYVKGLRWVWWGEVIGVLLSHKCRQAAKSLNFYHMTAEALQQL